MPDGDPVGEQGQGEPGAGAIPPAPASQQPTFTQADLDRINADTRRTEAEKERKRLLAELGLEDVESGKAAIAAAKAAEEASKSELQRAQEERDRAITKAVEAEARSTQVLIRARVEAALRDEGINPARVDHAIRLAPLGDVKVGDDGTVAGVEGAVKSVKDASPEWFGAPGKAFSAPDASGGAPPPVDYRTAPKEDRDAALRAINVKPVTRALSY